VFPDIAAGALERTPILRAFVERKGYKTVQNVAGHEVEGHTARGRPCRLADRSGDMLPREEVERLLGELVAAGAFGFRAVSEGGAAIRLDRPEFGHVQIAGRLYRLVVERYSARIERF
jgi:hypothetical protein